MSHLMEKIKLSTFVKKAGKNTETPGNTFQQEDHLPLEAKVTK